MGKVIFMITVLGLVFSLNGCTSKHDAENALYKSGYTDVVITGWNPFVCSKDDFYKTGFTATNPVGKRVSGTVCSGLLFKGSTIRF